MDHGLLAVFDCELFCLLVGLLQAWGDGAFLRRELTLASATLTSMVWRLFLTEKMWIHTASVYETEHVVTSSQKLTFPVPRQLSLWPLQERENTILFGGIGQSQFIPCRIPALWIHVAHLSLLSWKLRLCLLSSTHCVLVWFSQYPQGKSSWRVPLPLWVPIFT